MPAGSVIAAVIDLYGTLDATLFPGGVRPPIWLDEAPQADGAGSVSRPPYVIIRDGGGTNRWDTLQDAVTEGNFSIEVYYRSLSDCDAAMRTIMYNGQSPNQKAGLAFASLNLTSPSYVAANAVFPTKDQHSYAGFLDFEGQRVHKYTQAFKVMSGTKAN